MSRDFIMDEWEIRKACAEYLSQTEQRQFSMNDIYLCVHEDGTIYAEAEDEE